MGSTPKALTVTTLYWESVRALGQTLRIASRKTLEFLPSGSSQSNSEASEQLKCSVWNARLVGSAGYVSVNTEEKEALTWMAVLVDGGAVRNLPRGGSIWSSLKGQLEASADGDPVMYGVTEFRNTPNDNQKKQTPLALKRKLSLEISGKGRRGQWPQISKLGLATAKGKVHQRRLGRWVEAHASWRGILVLIYCPNVQIFGKKNFHILLYTHSSVLDSPWENSSLAQI